MIFNHISAPPLPVVILLLPFLGAMLILGFEGIKYIFKISGSEPFEWNRVLLKAFFLIVVTAEFALSIYLWHRFQNVRSAAYVLSAAGWTMTLTDISNSAIRSNIQVDILSASMAVITSLIALAACLRSMADRRNVLTPKKCIFFLLTLCGVQGVFFSGGFFNLFIFLLLSQIGASGLAGRVLHERSEFVGAVCYFFSRFLLFAIILGGCILLAIKYDIYSFIVMKPALQNGNIEKIAFTMLTAPLLYFFIKPPVYTTDSASRCYFAIRALAAFYSLFRIIFLMSGAVAGLERIPALLGGVGLAAVFTSLIFSASEREPIKFVSAIESAFKGFMLIALGISLGGLSSAAAIADYGYGALEAVLSLMLLFLPVSSVLSITAAQLCQESGGQKLWLCGGHIRRLGFTGLLFMLAVCLLGGLPPLVGFMGLQFLYRTANVVNPFLTLVIFAASMCILFKGLHYIAIIMFGEETKAGKFDGDRTAALPLILLFLVITVVSVQPGVLYEKITSPSVSFIINGVRYEGTQESNPRETPGTEEEYQEGAYAEQTEEDGAD